MFLKIKNILQVVRLLSILAKHDALFPLQTITNSFLARGFFALISKNNVSGRRGERLAKAMIEAGPSFVKIGHMFLSFFLHLLSFPAQTAVDEARQLVAQLVELRIGVFIDGGVPCV